MAALRQSIINNIDTGIVADRANVRLAATGAGMETVTLLCGSDQPDEYRMVHAFLKSCNSSAEARRQGVVSAFVAAFGTRVLLAPGLTVIGAAAADGGINQAAAANPILIDGTDCRPFFGRNNSAGVLEPPSRNTASAVLTIALLAIIKPATTTNATAFETNRPRALAGRNGITLPSRYFTVGDRDALVQADYTEINRAFNETPVLKETILRAMYGVTRRPRGIYSETLASQLVLVEGYGLAAYKLAVKAALACPNLELTFPMVNAELVALDRMARMRAAEAPFERNFGKAARGDMYTTVDAKEIPVLHYIGLQIERRRSPTAGNIAVPAVTQAFQAAVTAYLNANGFT